MVRCTAKTKDGSRCKNKALEGKKKCRRHAKQPRGGRVNTISTPQTGNVNFLWRKKGVKKKRCKCDKTVEKETENLRNLILGILYGNSNINFSHLRPEHLSFVFDFLLDRIQNDKLKYEEKLMSYDDYLIKNQKKYENLDLDIKFYK